MNKISSQILAEDNYNFGIQEIQREVEEQKTAIRKIRDEVKEVLKEDYRTIYNFFLHLLRNEYDYIILMSRRCQVLYQIFLRFIILKKDVKEIKSNIISNQALPYYINALNYKKIAIADDILIHGRAIKRLYRTIVKKCPNADVRIHVYTADEKIRSIEEGIQRILNTEYITCKDDWRNLSNKIVCSIFTANEPYTSFVSAYFNYDNPQDYKEMLTHKELSKIDISTEMQKKYGLLSTYFYEKEENRDDIFKYASSGECVRAYWKESTKKLTVIPYVFTKSMSAETSNDVCRTVSACLPESMNNIKTVLCENASDTMAEYKTRLLTCILSNIYWLKFKSKYNVKNDYYVDYNTLNESFSIPISKELKKLTVAEVEGILQIKPQNKDGLKNNICFSEEQELVEVLERAFAAENNTMEISKKYFQSAWHIDECRAQKNKERFNGLVIESFIQRASKRNINHHSILASLVNTWDNGLATGNYIYDDTKKQIGSYVMPGERAFVILIEKYPYLVKMLIFASKNIFRTTETETEQDFRKRKIGLLKQLAKEYCDKFQIQDYDAIANIIDLEKGYLSPLNQSLTLNVMLPTDKRRDDELIKKFINNNL